MKGFIIVRRNFSTSYPLNDNLWDDRDRPIREGLEHKLNDINKRLVLNWIHIMHCSVWTVTGCGAILTRLTKTKGTNK